MDVLAEVLKDLRVGWSFYACSDLGAPWGLAFAGKDGASFHFVVAGTCWLRLGRECIQLHTGDLALLPRGRDHRLGSEPDGRATPLAALPSERVGANAAFLRFGGDGARSLLICGGIRFAGAAAHPLLDTLPSLLVLRADELMGEEHITATLALMGTEARAPRPGGAAMLAHMADLLVVWTLREWLVRHADAQPGWLAGLRDPQVGQALALVHSREGERWTVAGLAAAVHLSRSAFSERFTRLVGVPPMRYLTRWRMRVADRLLCEEGAGLRMVAARLGYGTEAAFSRAYKRHTGVPPMAGKRAR